MRGARIAMLSAMIALNPLCGFAPHALAHETSMAVLSLKEQQPGQFVVRWLLSPGPDAETPPEHCRFTSPRLDCGDKGLIGPLTFEGLGRKHSATVIRIARRDGTTRSFTLTAAQPTITVSAGPGDARGWTAIAGTYLFLGIEHILLGVDHLLFVLGLLWIVRARWMLVKTITSFTVAHSIILAAATLGWIGVPEQPVNAAIALSIVFVGVEIIKLQRGEAGLTARYPWGVAFAFGLLHGFGFSRALTELGLPASDIPLALLFFNVGVEIGQIAFVLLVLALQWSHRMLQVCLPQWSQPARVCDWDARHVLVHRAGRNLLSEVKGSMRNAHHPRYVVLIGAVFSLFTAIPAIAHEQIGVAGGFVSGFTHPILGPDHLIAMVAVGLWGAQLGNPALWVLPITFPLVMALGGLLGVVGIPVPGVEIGVAASAIVLGAMVATYSRLPFGLAAILVAVFAVFHGHAHGTELPEAANPLAYGVGFVVATGLLHLSGIVIGLLVRWPIGERVVRVCGVLIAGLGGYFLFPHLGVIA